MTYSMAMISNKKEKKQITIKVLRAQIELIEEFRKTKFGLKYGNSTEFIKQAINEKLERMEKSK